MAGTAGHSANRKGTIQHDFSGTEAQRFHDVLEIVKRQIGELPPFIHAPRLPAAQLFGKREFTFAGIGISMCRHRPSREARLVWILERQVGGQHRDPVSTWEAIIGQLQAVEVDA